MARKIIAGTLIVLCSILLGLSIAGISLVWMIKQPLTQAATTRLQAIDNELGQAQTALQNAKLELERTLRIVESTEKSMLALKAEFTQVKTLFDNMNGTLDNQLIPSLKASREKINQAKSALQQLRVTLAQINSIPLLNLNIPGDQQLADLISGSDSLDGQIVQVEDLVKNASTFVSDASYLMGADFTETKTNLQNFLTVVQEYDQKLSGWRAQLAMLLGSLPGWIDGASIGLTIFLLWFGFSQISLILHGLTLWRGDDPPAVLPPQVVDDVQI